MSGVVTQSPTRSREQARKNRPRLPSRRWRGGAVAVRGEIAVDDPWALVNALNEANGLATIAKEEGYPPLTDALLEAAEAQLRCLHCLVPAQHMVNSGEEGEAVIFACPVPKHTIMLAPYVGGAAFFPVITPSAEFGESCATAGGLADAVLRQATNLVSQPPRQG